MDMTEDMHSVELFSTEELTIQIRRARHKVREIQRDREGQRDRDAQRKDRETGYDRETEQIREIEKDIETEIGQRDRYRTERQR